MPVLAPQQRQRLQFHGHAIVSADGMIADAGGDMPSALRHDADWRDFQNALDAAALVVLGRLGHERHPNPGRRRLVVTASVSAPTPDPRDHQALLWNPLAMPLSRVLDALEIETGIVAVAGGTGVFDYFLAAYDQFVLSEVHGLLIPGGTPCFSGGHPRQVLAENGLVPSASTLFDPAASVTSTVWRRPS